MNTIWLVTIVIVLVLVLYLSRAKYEGITGRWNFYDSSTKYTLHVYYDIRGHPDGKIFGTLAMDDPQQKQLPLSHIIVNKIYAYNKAYYHSDHEHMRTVFDGRMNIPITDNYFMIKFKMPDIMYPVEPNPDRFIFDFSIIAENKDITPMHARVHIPITW